MVHQLVIDIFRIVNGAKGKCWNGWYPKPAWEDKHCQYSRSAPASIPEPTSEDWELCANEGDNCNGLDTNAAQWVKYGDDNHYYYRLIISTLGYIHCKDMLFNDPISGNKYCYRAPAEYTFGTVVGKWVQLPSCTGCASNEYKKEVGVTELTESEITDTWSTSIETTVKAGFEFDVASSSISVSETVGREVASRMKSQFSTIATESSTFTCNKNKLFQWQISAISNDGISDTNILVGGIDNRCMYNSNGPQCPPGFCVDRINNTECQTFKESIE